MLSILAKTESFSSNFKLGTDIPMWVLVAIAMVAFVWIIYCYISEVACQSLNTKLFLGLIRISIILALLFILSEPVWEQTHSEIKKSHLLFLTDSSMSMNIKDRYKTEEREQLQRIFPPQVDVNELRRIDVANHLVKNSKRLQELNDECHLHFFRFDTVLGTLPAFSEIEAKGQKTNVFDHIVKAIDAMQGRVITGVFVLTDGQHNSGQKTVEQVVHYAEMRDIPVYTVGIGSTAKKRDIILTSVEAPEIALLGDNVPFEVEIKHVGYEGEQIPIYLKWGDERLAEQIVTLGKEEERQRVVISHTFQTPGDYNIKVDVPKQGDEFSTDNNVRQHNIRIIEQKFRVLYLESLPRWEYRYLKNALIRDSTVLANTWLFEADSGFPQEKSPEAPEIVGFPSKEELFKYHCIIIGDVSVSSQDQLTRDRQELLAEYVKDHGGGLIFLAGMNHNPKEYIDTALEPMLPISLERIEDLTGPFTSQYRFHLTPEGKRHPIMRLVSDTESNLQMWDQGAGFYFYWYFPVHKPKPGATVLAANRETRSPIFLSQFYGKGKTFFSATDATWRWRYRIGDKYFYRFWGQVIRHVSMGRLVGTGRQYHLNVENPQYVIGEMVNIRLRVVENQSHQSVEQKEWKIYYTLPSGEQKEKLLKANNEEAGTFEGTLIATEVGSYKVWIDPPDKKEISVIFHVVAPLAESGKPQLNEKFLTELASNGKYLKPYELENTLVDLSPKTEKIPQRVEIQSLLDKDWVPWIFLVLLSLFTLEWIVRKTARLL